MIRRRDLVRALGEHNLADWVLVEREQDVAIADPTLQRTERWLRWTLTVHHDSPTGRGSARVAIDAADGNAAAAVLQAVTLARASIGNLWVTRPPAAPARVELIEPALVKGDLLAAATKLAQLEGPAGATVEARATVLREHVFVVTRQGLHTDWLATHLRVDARVVAHGSFLVISREARRREDLALGPAILSAVEDLQLLASATSAAPGPATIVVRTDALLHDGIGLWGVFVGQADAVVERMGLTRYRERAPVVPGADHGSGRLTITSNGALDFGVASAPVGDEGEPIRRFPLVERGIAAGLGLTPREGSLRGRDPNGGVRNLVVNTGDWSGGLDGNTTRVIEVKRLRSLSLDPYTGDASAEILLGIEHAKGTSTPFAGGSLRIDAIDALARGKRSKDIVTRGPYSGPAAVLIEGGELLDWLPAKAPDANVKPPSARPG